MWRTDWVKKKVRVAAQLANGDCGGLYGDAALILCSCLSALAAEVWPGKGMDRNRFVELLEKYCKPSFGSTRLSIPLLVGDLRRFNRPEATLIDSKFLQQFNPRQVLRGEEVDRNENEIRAACGSLSPNTSESLATPVCCIEKSDLHTRTRAGLVMRRKASHRPDWQQPSAMSIGISRRTGVYTFTSDGFPGSQRARLKR